MPIHLHMSLLSNIKDSVAANTVGVVEGLPPHLKDWHLPTGWSFGSLGGWRHGARHTQEIRDPLGRSLAMVSTPEPSFDAWLMDEARGLSYHSHPLIPTTYHYWGRSERVTRGPAYLRRWVDGESLYARLGRNERFPFPDAVRLFRDMGQGLAYLHDHGLPHGALTPEHLHITPTGRLWLLGWEWAVRTDARPEELTPAFGDTSPPEWGREWRPTFQSDQWSLGKIFEQCLEGGPDAVPARLRDLVAKATDPDPGSRYPTVASMLRELDRRMAVTQVVLDPRPRKETPEALVRWVTGDDYEVQHQIGAGGRGTVWRVRDLHLGRDVALKVLHSHIAGDHGAVQQFRQEAMLASKLHHPALVPVLDLDQRAGAVWYTMPLAEQGSLATRIAQGPQPENDVITGLEHVLEGLAAAHEQGVMHRDLKPENVLVGRWRRWLLADFGLACLAGVDAPNGGTLGFAAPEQLLGEPQTTAVDVYGAAALAVAAWTGTPPVTTTSVEAAIAQQLQEKYDLSGVPQRMRRLVRQCLSADPEKRPKDATALLDAWRRAATATPWWKLRLGPSPAATPRSVGTP